MQYQNFQSRRENQHNQFRQAQTEKGKNLNRFWNQNDSKTIHGISVSALLFVADTVYIAYWRSIPPQSLPKGIQMKAIALLSNVVVAWHQGGV